CAPRISPSLAHLCFYAPAPHRALHSSPTRRSSDLRCASTICHRCACSARSASRSIRRPGLGTTRSSVRVAVRLSTPGGRPKRARSEEHTSELQSRENLVCRLLLEKKKRESQQIARH